jgi:phytoene dehydrogenase-like protein
MDCEVVVVGGGIGGLTVAALLAQRGLDVCLFERESKTGGCASSFEKFGYTFDQGYGLFTGWEAGGIQQKVFAELPVDAPELHPLNSSYLVRLPDGCEIPISSDREHFKGNLQRAFPECAERAVAFYDAIAPLADAWRRAIQKSPDLLAASKASRVISLLREGLIGNDVIRAAQQSTAEHLRDVSFRFRSFVDLQLQTFTQSTSSDVPYLAAAVALTNPLERTFGLGGGAAALADRLADSIKKSGGRVRLDSPVLRLAYDSSGSANGVDLLNGEVVKASKAIVSNLTVWDTYGKLVGLNRTPTEIRKQLNALRSWGSYQLYLGLNEAASLPADRILGLCDWEEGQSHDPESQLFFTSALAEARAPAGKKAITVHYFTDVEEWFTFHQDETELEAADQQMLERCWQRLHTVIPELGDSVEVIETATPRTFYELTRRKLGMVGGLPLAGEFWQEQPSYLTAVPNLYLISDTANAWGIEELTRSAWLLANKLAS